MDKPLAFEEITAVPTQAQLEAESESFMSFANSGMPGMSGG